MGNNSNSNFDVEDYKYEDKNENKLSLFTKRHNILNGTPIKTGCFMGKLETMTKPQM